MRIIWRSRFESSQLNKRITVQEGFFSFVGRSAHGFLFHLLFLTNLLLSECCFSLFLFLFRLVLNPFFGVLLDKNGARKKKWLWHNLKEHVHAPPFQPVTFMITKQLSIRCLSQASSDFKCFFSYQDHTFDKIKYFSVNLRYKTLLKRHSKQYFPPCCSVRLGL